DVGGVTFRAAGADCSSSVPGASSSVFPIEVSLNWRLRCLSQLSPETGVGEAISWREPEPLTLETCAGAPKQFAINTARSMHRESAGMMTISHHHATPRFARGCQSKVINW